jgi:transcriptional regulator with XRE-family HTH domain
MSKPQNLVKNQLAAFGANLKARRLQKGWTLDDLALRSELSKPFLSRLESGGRQASIAAVLTLSQVFDVSITEMFETQIALEPCLIVRKSEAVAHDAQGLTYLPLSQAGHSFNLRPIRVTVSPDRAGNEHYRHDGEEWIYVLSGKITLSLAGEKYDLDTGDAVHFDSRLPHRVTARSKTAPELLLVASPLALERRVSGQMFLPSSSKRAIPMLEISDHARQLLPPS